MRNEELLKYLPSPDRLIYIWEKDRDKSHYIVESEARLGEKEIKPFGINIAGGKYVTESLRMSILGKIPERKNRNKQPGVNPAMEVVIENLSQEDIKNVPLS